MAPDASSHQGGDNLITSLEALEAIYGESPEAALKKEIDHISDLYRTFIEAAPFVVVATVGPEGIDCSPRGDPAGFVRVVDGKTVMIPDRRGNNRVDSLRNVVRDPRISLLFLIPGVGETIRINGTAQISVDPELCASFAMHGKNPSSVLIVTVGSIYYQCPKALVRSKLWTRKAVYRATSCRPPARSCRPSPRAKSTPANTTKPIRSGSRTRSTRAAAVSG